jgi:hypothetical protein
MSRARLARTAGALCLALAFAGVASPAFACSGGYSYAGLYASRPAGGIAASLTMLTAPVLGGGHVAAWVGIGGPGLGPNSSDEWLQVGLASFDSSGGRLYYELATPGQEPRYVELAAGIQPGKTIRVALLELPFAPGTWVIVTPVGLAGPFFLPRSHGVWAPVATAESWAAGGSRCNRSSYRFGRIELAGGSGRWRALRHASRLQDPGWRLHRYSRATFSASAA